MMVDGCGGGRKRASVEVKSERNLTFGGDEEKTRQQPAKRQDRGGGKRVEMTEEANEAAVNYASNETQQQATASGGDGLAELKTGPTTP